MYQMADNNQRRNNRPVRPTRLRPEDISGMTMKDFYPNRESQETNTEHRMAMINAEIDKLFALSRSITPLKDDFPTLYHELPTLWAMIEEKKFKYWEPRDQGMLKEMIRLRFRVVRSDISDEDAEKQMGISLAERYIYPKTGRRH